MVIALVAQTSNKAILTPQQCEILMPHWPLLYNTKLQPLRTLPSKISRFGRSDGREPPQRVLASRPIIVTRDGYIINGKHRAAIAAVHGFGLEAYVIASERELCNNVPPACYGEGLDKCIDALDKRLVYEAYARNQGIHSIGDIIRLGRIV